MTTATRSPIATKPTAQPPKPKRCRSKMTTAAIAAPALPDLQRSQRETLSDWDHAS